ncbi:hypothetical protein TWF281_002805 [Arthrobotrys megalospora]
MTTGVGATKNALEIYKSYGEAVKSLSLEVELLGQAMTIDQNRYVTAANLPTVIVPMIGSFSNLTTVILMNAKEARPVQGIEIFAILNAIFDGCKALKHLKLSIDIKEESPNGLDTIIAAHSAGTELQTALPSLKNLELAMCFNTSNPLKRYSTLTGIWLLAWLSTRISGCTTLREFSFRFAECFLLRRARGASRLGSLRPIESLPEEDINPMSYKILFPKVQRLRLWGFDLSMKVFSEYFEVVRDNVQELEISQGWKFNTDEIVTLLLKYPGLQIVHLKDIDIKAGAKIDWGMVMQAKQVLKCLKIFMAYTNSKPGEVEDGIGSSFLQDHIKTLKYEKVDTKPRMGYITGSWKVTVEL